jgi:hypothetical protein
VGQPAPAGTGELSAVSCADAHHCWAVGVPGPNAPTTTATTGTATTATPVTGTTVIAATVNGGRTWSTQPLTPGTAPPALTGVSCPGAKVCMAVGSSGANPGTGVVLTTHNGGKSWAPSVPPAGSIAVTSVKCTTAADCTVVASDGTADWSAATSNFGQTWLRQGTLPAGMGGGLTLSCAPAGPCLVAGFSPTTAGHGQGALALSTNGGMTWVSATVPPGVGLLRSAACTSSTNCLAAGTTSTTVSDVVPAKGLLLDSTNGGMTWSASPNAPSVDDVFGVACPTKTSCALVGTNWVGTPVIGTGAVAESRDAGTTFSPSTTAYTPLTLTAVACPTAVNCVAVGGDTVARITLTPPRRTTST